MEQNNTISIAHQHMHAALDACSEMNVRCVEIWHSDALKMIVKVAIDDTIHETFFLVPLTAAHYPQIKMAVKSWILELPRVVDSEDSDAAHS